MKRTVILSMVLCLCLQAEAKIDRKTVVRRNCPVVTAPDVLSSLSVGNGGFAYTVDITGMQTFPEVYRTGVPLGTMSDWGWHAFPDTAGYAPSETWVTRDFGRGHEEIYAAQFKTPGRRQQAADYFRVNPHRLHLGLLGLDLGGDTARITGARQRLDMWQGRIDSRFAYDGKPYRVTTVCHPDKDMTAARIVSKGGAAVVLRLPYPTGGHADDACRLDAASDALHSTAIVAQGRRSVLLCHTLDTTKYWIRLAWEGKARLQRTGRNAFRLTTRQDSLTVTCQFSPGSILSENPSFGETIEAAARHWTAWWNGGGMADFSRCTDERAAELERRVVLSQYLLAVNDAGDTPPQETGLTYNSWFGKMHLEMIWWHQACFALWGHPEILDRSLSWYRTVLPQARNIARRQGFKGARWMKMTDPWGGEAPSNVGSYLIWQQPHLIYLAELLYRAHPSAGLLARYNDMVQETAEFMADFVTRDAEGGRYVLRGCIPAQETLKADSTVNPPLELSYWHLGLSTALKWRERTGMPDCPRWRDITDSLSPLAAGEDSLYLAAESMVNTYHNIRLTSDHPAVVGALGMMPECPLVDKPTMRRTLYWILKHWNWDKTWGWDYPLVAMTAARLGLPDKAVDVLLADRRTNTYLPNGHNYQDARLRVYLPGNGGLLTAVAMMCAGWDSSEGDCPGFPKDGRWNVEWEGLRPMP